MLATFVFFTLGLVCIVFPSASIKVIQKFLSGVTDRQSIRMRTHVPEEDRQIRPVFSIIFGFVFLLFAFLAYSQSSG